MLTERIIGKLRGLSWRMRFGRRLTMRGLSHIGPLNFFSVREGGEATIGKIVTGSNVVVSCPGGKLVIGDGVFLNNNCYVVCRGRMEIGDGCVLGPGTCVVDHNHRFDETGVLPGFKIGTVRIGARCWIGANAVILKDTEIGEGCIVGAGAVVQGVIPAHSIVKSGRNLDIVRIGLI